MTRYCHFQSAESLTVREGFPGNWQNERHFHLDHQRTSAFYSIILICVCRCRFPLRNQSVSSASPVPACRGSVVSFWLWLCYAVPPWLRLLVAALPRTYDNWNLIHRQRLLRV